ncbi:MAG TPA: FAD-dependent monooxygenase [Blastocatellia bacterium]|nr:FAD-dependent monooxygenase [Blastocatellia bacterium]
MNEYDVIIVGAGPSGSTAAAGLAAAGLRTLLLEEKRMPRHKLCGEFVTPEAFPTLRRLGVLGRMLEAGGQKLSTLRLVAPGGRFFQASVSDVSTDAPWALSISRSEFDRILMERAREAGAICLEGIGVRSCLFENERPIGVETVSILGRKQFTFKAPIIVDASGRNSRLMLDRVQRVGGRPGSRLYAMKAHFTGVEGIGTQLELYFFPGGYGGLSRVENGLVNLCFIASEKVLKSAGGDRQVVLDRTILRNPLASERLKNAKLTGKWHSTGPLTFGKKRLSAAGIIAAGDATGMIDPFTGTGIQMAIRTGEMVCESIIEAEGVPVHDQFDRPSLINHGHTGFISNIVERYSVKYKEEFADRMRVASALRRIVFSAAAINLGGRTIPYVPRLGKALLKATRAGHPIRRSESESESERLDSFES